MFVKLDHLDRLNYKTLEDIANNFKEFETAFKGYIYKPIKNPKYIEPQEILDNFNVIEENIANLYILLKNNPKYGDIEQYYKVKGITVDDTKGHLWEDAYPDLLERKINRWVNFQNYIWEMT